MADGGSKAAGMKWEKLENRQENQRQERGRIKEQGCPGRYTSLLKTVRLHSFSYVKAAAKSHSSVQLTPAKGTDHSNTNYADIEI